MQTRTVLLFGVVFCVAFAIISEVSAGGGGGKWKEKMKKCADGEMNIDEFFKGKEECKPKPKKEEEEEERRRRRSPGDGKKHKKGGKWGKGKDTCMAVCMWKQQGVLDDSGAFNEEGCKDYVNKSYPEEVREDAISKIKECAEKHSSTFSMDEKCGGYSKFKKCLWGAHMKACKIEWGGKGGKGGKKQDPPASANEDGGDEE